VVGLERDASMQSFVASAATSQAVVIEYVVGDVYHLDYPDDTYDIVFAHQVLQHLSDPVAALREMRRICKPGGLVAARDGSHETCTWAPESPSLDLWLELYFAVGRGNGTTPDAGRRLLAWANASGFDEVVFSASTEYLADSDRRQRWADMWQDRMLNSDLATQALERGLLSFRY
jgi:ubiquinone/menaquinone biosynthesis C-methylase UbiE